MPRKEDQPITVAEVLELTPGDKDNPSWINGTLKAVISDVKAIKDTMHSCVLSDPDTDAAIACTFIGRKFLPPNGSTVEMSGSMSRTEYKGTDQITAFAKCQVNTLVKGSGSAPAAASRASAPAAGRSAPASHGGGPFMGVTVGMALNNAGADARDALTPDELGDHEHVAKWVWIRASVYLKVSQALESGKLAKTSTAQTQAAPDPEPEPEREPEPPPARRAAPAARAPAARPAPGPDGSVGHDPDEQDVPF